MTKEDILNSVNEFLQKSSFLGLTKDIPFKALFARNEKSLKSLLEHFLPLPKGAAIVNIEVKNPDLLSDSAADERGKFGKTFILDLRVEFIVTTPEGPERDFCNVEMQASVQQNLPDRVLAYSSRLFSGQLKEGESYTQLSPVYSLLFTKEPVRDFIKAKGKYHRVFNIREIDEPYSLFSPGMCFVVVELSEFKKALKECLDLKEFWCYMLKYSSKMGLEESEALVEKGGHEMTEALKALLKVSQDDALREVMLAREKAINDQITNEEVAREEGHQKGIEKGIQKGIEKGIQKGREETALNMIKDNFNIEIISKYTGLSKVEIEQLKNFKK